MAAQNGVTEEWPALPLDDCMTQLCAPGALHEITEAVIDGVPVRVWKNVPSTFTDLATHARRHDDRVFLVLGEDRITYAAWYRAAAALAAHLTALGLRPGDRVALAVRNLPEWPVAYFAALSIGAIVVPLNAWWSGDELAFALADSGARMLLCDGERHARLTGHAGAMADLEHLLVTRCADVRAEVPRLEDVVGTPATWASLPDADLPSVPMGPDDPATIFYTSGTTSQPKGALGTHRNALTNIFSSSFATMRAALRRGGAAVPPAPKVVLLTIPFFHVTGCNARLLGSMWNGDTVVLMHRWDVEEALALIEREGVNNAGGVPTIGWQLVEHPSADRFDLSSLESITYGGAPAAPDLVRRIKSRFGASPGCGWGMTETSATVTSHNGEEYLARPDSAGPAVPVAQLRIMDIDGVRACNVGEVGELWVSGPMVVRGYWQRPEATAETFVQEWCRTGDLARLDDDGFLYIVDRAKDIVIRGGENIYSIEVENVLFDHPAVIDCALVPIPHRTLGEEPGAVVSVHEGVIVTEAELQDWVRLRLAGFKVPARIAFYEGPLPRNAHGKILKKELVALFAAPARA